MVPFDIITNSCSRNYRAKSLPAQPRTDVVSSPLQRSGGDENGGEPGGGCDCAHTGGSRIRAGPTSTLLDPICYALRDPIDHRGAETWVAADPERGLGDPIGGLQRARPRGDRGPGSPGCSVMLPASSRRESIRCSQQVQLQRAPLCGAAVAQRERDSRTSSAPPPAARAAARTCSSSGCKRGVQAREVLAPARGEAFQPVRLGHAERGLHVGDLEVVAHVREDVLVVVAGRAARRSGPRSGGRRRRRRPGGHQQSRPHSRSEATARAPRGVGASPPRRPPPSSCGGRDRTSRSRPAPNVPARRPPMREPSASQQSSISTRSCSRHSASTPGRVERVAEAVGGEDRRACAGRSRPRTPPSDGL